MFWGHEATEHNSLSRPFSSGCSVKETRQFGGLEIRIARFRILTILRCLQQPKNLFTPILVKK
jgi:hypothetical protein